MVSKHREGLFNSIIKNNDDDDGLLKLRHLVSESVTLRVKGEICCLSSHFGEHYERADDPEAAVYRNHDGNFRWLAFGFSPWRMWDLHVGVVPIDRHKLSLGFHISERASSVLMTDLERLASEVGVAVQHQKAAVEYQANLPPVLIDAVPVEAIVDTVAGLCRKYAPVAAKITCPAEMRDNFIR